MSVYPKCFEECGFRSEGTLIKHGARRPPSLRWQRGLTSEGPEQCHILLETRLRNHSHSWASGKLRCNCSSQARPWHSAACCRKKRFKEINWWHFLKTPVPWHHPPEWQWHGVHSYYSLGKQMSCVWPVPQRQCRLLVHTSSVWVGASVSEEWSPCLQSMCTLSLLSQAQADGVILHQIFCVEIPKRTFWWFSVSACSTNLHIWNDIRDTLNKLQLSSKLLQSGLKGFS